ncbi:hypothetical protein [Pedobacter nutrimenti]|uniref:hypothetical protein n=1 Tax=Pedobacter nutrimenti TaxID=1241337 RepID=UPI002930656E|nr:hypothetical protein [Pedobacter nutrimenti]
MKKLKLNALALQTGEVLSRSQLKKVLGGSGSSSGACDNECTTEDKSCTMPGQTAGTCKSHGIYPIGSCPGRTSVLLCDPS